MSGVYTVTTGPQDVTAVQDLLALVASSTCVCVLQRVKISIVGGTADAGDANEQLLTIKIRSGQTSAGSGGATVTPVPTDGSNAAATFTARRNDTTQANTGTIVEHVVDGINSRAGLDLPLMETEQVIFGGGRRCTIELTDAPTGTLKIIVTATVQQIWQ